MSRMVREKGTATLVVVPKCEKLSHEIEYLKIKGYVFEDVYEFEDSEPPDEFTDIEEYHSDNLIRANNQWFEVKYEEIDEGYISIEKNDNGIAFDCIYYNGGGCLSEILEHWINTTAKGGSV
jgi:hypothetical protein